MAEEHQWEVALEAAWGQLRADVADVLADLEEGECVVVEWGPELLEGTELEGAELDETELEGLSPSPGGAPYVQATGWGEGMVRIEAVSNHYLSQRYTLGGVEADALTELGWLEPTCTPEEDEHGGSSNFWFDVEAREADLAAVLLVCALREVYGCLHPSLLATSGVYSEEAPNSGATCECEAEPEVPDLEDIAPCWPSSRGELQAVVLDAVGSIRGEPARQDGDGDVPIQAGRSVVFVKVLSNRPGVELFAELVLSLEAADPQALARELNILNRNHLSYSFHIVDGVVVMRQMLIATPFVPFQLKVALESFCSEVDDIARDLVERVGGHRFICSDAEAAAGDNDEGAGRRQE